MDCRSRSAHCKSLAFHPPNSPRTDTAIFSASADASTQPVNAGQRTPAITPHPGAETRRQALRPPPSAAKESAYSFRALTRKPPAKRPTKSPPLVSTYTEPEGRGGKVVSEQPLGARAELAGYASLLSTSLLEKPPRFTSSVREEMIRLTRKYLAMSITMLVSGMAKKAAARRDQRAGRSLSWPGGGAKHKVLSGAGTAAGLCRQRRVFPAHRWR